MSKSKRKSDLGFHEVRQMEFKAASHTSPLLVQRDGTRITEKMKTLDEIVQEAGKRYFDEWPEKDGYEHLAFQDEVFRACEAAMDFVQSMMQKDKDAFIEELKHMAIKSVAGHGLIVQLTP